MTNDQLIALGIDEKWLEPLNTTFDKYEINTPKRQAGFIGQCQHESGNFKTLEENLHYNAGALMRVWPSRFPDANTAEKYDNNPQAIANKVYAGRMGNTEDGDGWKYHGRGVIQLTGKDNYVFCGQALKLPLMDNPDLLLEPMNAMLSAGWFWNKRGLNATADVSGWEEITRKINGGVLGLDDRIAKITKALQILEG